jgi:hypothetical protein
VKYLLATGSLPPLLILDELVREEATMVGAKSRHLSCLPVVASAGFTATSWKKAQGAYIDRLVKSVTSTTPAALQRSGRKGKE